MANESKTETRCIHCGMLGFPEQNHTCAKIAEPAFEKYLEGIQANPATDRDCACGDCNICVEQLREEVKRLNQKIEKIFRMTSQVPNVAEFGSYQKLIRSIRELILKATDGK